jgi:microcystin degradation protein MlrC
MKEWPHTDVLQTIQNAFQLTADMAEGMIHPHMAVWDCRMIAPYHTLKQPMKGLVDQMKAAEEEEGVLSVSLVHGFWQADVPDLGSKMLVITDDQPDLGHALAKDLGRKLFAMRGQTAPGYLDLGQGIEAIRSAENHPVVVADVGDIPGGGAPGDATYVLEGLLDAGIEGAALAYIWDGDSVDRAAGVGVGSSLTLDVGGKTCEQSGRTLQLRCRVKGIYRDLVVSEPDGMENKVGDVAVVESGGVTIALARERTAALSSNHFNAINIDPAACTVMVIKSANNFYAGFEKVAADTIYVDAGGVTGGRIEDLDLRRIDRPKWPWDEAPFS